MTLIVLAYFGGILTILSPCVLPVVPFVFARAGRPFATSILPLLGGMAVTFALVATLAAVGGGQGAGRVDAQRLYQLIRQQGDVADHTIEFEDPGVQAFSFTFG